MFRMEAKYPRIGKELKKWRGKMRQVDACLAFGIEQPFYSEIERGRKDPSIETLILIHQHTKVSLYDLLGLKDPDK